MAYDDNNYKINDISFLNGLPYATNRYIVTTNGLPLVTFNPLGFSNVFTYNDKAQLLTSTDARGHTSTNYYDDTTGNLLAVSDARGNTTANYYDPSTSLFVGSRDAIG